MEELQHEQQSDVCHYLADDLDALQCANHLNVPEEEEETHHANLANLEEVIVEIQVSREPWEPLLASRQAKHQMAARRRSS